MLVEQNNFFFSNYFVEETYEKFNALRTKLFPDFNKIIV